MLIVDVPTTEETLDLLSVDKYRQTTGDTTSSDDDVTAALVDALQICEEFLRRKLINGTYTESLEIYGVNTVYPSVTPVTAVDPESLDVLGPNDTISLGEVPWTSLRTKVNVTYTGGYTDQNLPRTIAIAIITAAHNMIAASQASSSGTPFGATSVSVGDVSVSYGSTGLGADAGELSSQIRRSLQKYRVKVV